MPEKLESREQRSNVRARAPTLEQAEKLKRPDFRNGRLSRVDAGMAESGNERSHRLLDHLKYHITEVLQTVYFSLARRRPSLHLHCR